MRSRLFVGNLAFHTTEREVHRLFAEIAPVAEIKLVLDRDSGLSRGFAFVKMETSGDAAKAMAEMNGRNLHGRELRVTEAQERQTDNRPFVDHAER